MSREIGRRTFIYAGLAAGGGLIVGVRLLRAPADLADVEGPVATQPGESATGELNAYVEIAEDGAVTITAPCPEIGQGTRTSLAQIAVEELDVDWSAVRVLQGEANARYGGQVVGGSDSARDYWQPLRSAGAMARQLLIQAAAAAWGVPAGECYAAQGRVHHPDSGRSDPYGSLARAAAGQRTQGAVPLKEPDAFRLIGTSPPGVDIVDVVRGAAQYGMDVRVPDMLFAVVARPPVPGSRVQGFDGSEVASRPGVLHVVEIPPHVPGGDLYAAVRGGVAVVARDTWSAMSAREALRVRWGPGRDEDASTDGLRTRLHDALERPPAAVLREDGDVAGALAQARTIVEADYQLPPLAHVAMEPGNSTASVTAEACEVWGPVQNPQRLREALGRALALPLSAVRVFPTLSGGGFGRRLAVDYGVEAALLSRQIGAPVQVVWTREDDIRFDYLRPASAHRVRAGLDGSGRVVAWDHHVVTTSLLRHIEVGDDGTDPAIYDVQGAADVPLAVSDLRVAYTSVDIALQMGSWRSVAHSFNTFVVGAFIAELASRSGRDALALHRELLGEPRLEEIRLPLPGRRGQVRVDVGRLLAVLDLVAARAGWGRELPDGWGRGIAWCEYKGSYAAHVAEVSVAGGRPRVRRVVAALDCGRVINPSGTRAQVEGAVMDAVATVFKWGVQVSGGAIVQSNFHDYPLLRIDEAPIVETHLVEGGSEPAGAGEPPYPSVAPAIVAAMHAAGMAPIRQLPIAST